MTEEWVARASASSELPPDTQQFALLLDEFDELKRFRNEFFLPQVDPVFKILHPSCNKPGDLERREVVYLCGNSMGLQPKRVSAHLEIVMKQWAELGVLGYHHGPLPASHCDLEVSKDFAKLIVGAEDTEVTLTNNLTVNLHLMLTTFYQPRGDKNCILIENMCFPSDYYAVESQIVWHGLDPNKCIIKVTPRPGEYLLRNEDICEILSKEAHRIALVILPGIQYYTGQVFDVPTITKHCHQVTRCPIGWDLAHSVGNIPLQLHEWNIDFAVWCTYKYINAGPGCLGGIFVHKKYHHVTGSYGPQPNEPGVYSNGPQLTGWWSHRNETRFDMSCCMELAEGALAYRISNPPPLLAASLRAALEVFTECGGMQPIRKKSLHLTGYLLHLLTKGRFRVIPHFVICMTSVKEEEHGSQISLLIKDKLDEVLKQLSERGFICDARRPNCLRVSPVSLYNTFEEVYKFAKALHEILNSITK